MSEVGDHLPSRSKRRGSTPPWPVRVITLLLALQAITLLSLGLLGGPWITWSPALQELGRTVWAFESPFVGSILLALAITAVLAIPCFLLAFRTGWLLSMSLQALLLATCIMLYVEHRPAFIYPIMLLCIVAVLYLNSYDVRLSFHIGPARAQPEVEDGS